MEYLLIAFLILVVISPLAWLKSSPGQVRVTRFRQRAAARRLQVQLVPEIDADETVTRPAAVRYLLAYPQQDAGAWRARMGLWTLVRDSRRGRESPWVRWKWFRDEAPAPLHGRIGEVIDKLPAVAYGLRAERAGVAVYLRESGEDEAVDRVADSLETLISGSPASRS